MPAPGCGCVSAAAARASSAASLTLPGMCPHTWATASSCWCHRCHCMLSSSSKAGYFSDARPSPTTPAAHQQQPGSPAAHLLRLHVAHHSHGEVAGAVVAPEEGPQLAPAQQPRRQGTLSQAYGSCWPALLQRTDSGTCVMGQGHSSDMISSSALQELPQLLCS